MQLALTISTEIWSVSLLVLASYVIYISTKIETLRDVLKELRQKGYVGINSTTQRLSTQILDLKRKRAAFVTVGLYIIGAVSLVIVVLYFMLKITVIQGG